MKICFNSLDIACCVFELQSLIGFRVNQIYDVDHKTYVIKLHRQEEKHVLLLESGTRIHTTVFDIPKSISPSGFTMKLRKHLKNKRIESIRQLGNDRIVDLQFGSGEASYHVIIELFNRGNIILADYTFVILNVLRPHTEGDKFRFAVKEEYPASRAREVSGPPDFEKLTSIFESVKKNEKVSKILLPHLDYGTALIEHILLRAGLPRNSKYPDDMKNVTLESLAENLMFGEEIVKQIKSQQSKGYIIQKKEPREGQEDLVTYQEFHPYLFLQHSKECYVEYSTFNAAVDEFFCKVEGQKIESKALQLEKEALQKVTKIKDNQQQRIEGLQLSQEIDTRKAELIMANSELIDEAIFIVRKAIALQMSWPEIDTFVTDLAAKDHLIGLLIHKLKLEINHITVSLSDPYCESDSEDFNNKVLVDIDLGSSAHANATSYYTNKKSAALKELKTIESQSKAVKSAEKKAKLALKEIKTMSTITKARKEYWFEKFFWFISSDNYLVIGGRDQQQNEVIVKRYLKKGDLYVHADIHGASSIVIKNPSGDPVPPRTLSEAGNMAVCYSLGWEMKIMHCAWWVRHDQVSKTAPSGEYLTTGSFMIRGQKNVLLPAQLAMGFAFLFKLEESSVFRHKEERKAKTVGEVVGDAFGVVKEFEELETEKLLHVSNTDDSGVITDTINLETKVNLEEADTDDLFPNTDIDYSNEMEKLSLEAPAEFNLEFNSEVVHTSSGVSSGKKDLKHDVTNKSKEVGQKTIDKERNSLKRGQKSKLKKIKEKYKDQDEEEKQLRMSILQSAGVKKEPKKLRKQGKRPQMAEEIKMPSRVSEPKIHKKESNDIDAIDEDDLVAADLGILDFLTGQPHPDDELLFAIPVVAPYAALVNYKYKVKITPGTGKRGKSGRTAVEHFTRLKDCSLLEKNLIRNVKDQNLFRNFPGNVKLSILSTKK